MSAASYQVKLNGLRQAVAGAGKDGTPPDGSPAKVSSDTPGLGGTTPAFVVPSPATAVVDLVLKQASLILLGGLAALGAAARRPGGHPHQPALCGDRP